MRFTTLCGGLCQVQLYDAVHNLFNVRSRIHWGPQNKMSLPDHNTGIFMAYSLRIVYGFFNVPHLF